MSQENVERVRLFIDEVNRGGWPAPLMAFIHDDVEIDWSRSTAPFRGIYRGREGATRFGETVGIWEHGRLEPTNFIDGGDAVLVPNIVYFRGRGGIEVQVSATFGLTIRDGRCARWCVYQDLAEALEALGLSE